VFLVAAARLEARGVRTVRQLQKTVRPPSPAIGRPHTAFG